MYEKTMKAVEDSHLIDELEAEAQRLRQDQPQYHVLDFGKHKGQRLQDVPYHYLRWLYEMKPSYRKVVGPFIGK
jgi:hypothetical protein